MIGRVLWGIHRDSGRGERIPGSRGGGAELGRIAGVCGHQRPEQTGRCSRARR